MPELADFTCGAVVGNDEAVRLLFDPVASAAAELMSEEINLLAGLGVDLRGVHLDRLEWDLSRGMRNALHEFSERAEGNVDAVPPAIDLLQAAKSAGYNLIPEVQHLAESYNELASEAARERSLREETEEKLRQVIEAARGGTKRARRRVNRVLRELGIQLDVTEGD